MEGEEEAPVVGAAVVGAEVGAPVVGAAVVGAEVGAPVVGLEVGAAVVGPSIIAGEAAVGLGVTGLAAAGEAVVGLAVTGAMDGASVTTTEVTNMVLPPVCWFTSEIIVCNVDGFITSSS